MMKPFDRAVEWFFGRGRYAVTIPPMDGALRPNSLLDNLPAVASAADADNIALVAGKLVFSSGQHLIEARRDGTASTLLSFASDIAAIASDGAGRCAVALVDGTLHLGEGLALSPQNWLTKQGCTCPTAMAFDGRGGLIVCNGSRHNGVTDWATDLLQQRHSGSVVRLDLSDGSAKVLSVGLAFPAGVLVQGNRIVVAEAWRHRLVELGRVGAPVPLLEDLPGYPSRMTEADGCVFLCVFAPRSQLVEFVLREPAYLRRMMREVPKEYWIAPAYRSGESFLEPLQGGGVKQMGILKPWAPSRSYGFLIELDAGLEPVRSMHSRADGSRHGITSVATVDGDILVTTRGRGEVLAMAGGAVS